MKLSYLQSIDPCDPLPKLGKKVQPKKPESLEAIRAREVEAFERGVFNAVKAAAEETGLRNFARSFAHDGTGYIEPEPVVSFADAAEMADGWIKWDGGECPVDGGLAVEVKFRGGEKNACHKANAWNWDHVCGSFDIIAYRIHKEPEKKAPTFEDWSRAFCVALKNHSLDEINAAITPVLEGVGHKPGMLINNFPQAFPALIAALEALK